MHIKGQKRNADNRKSKNSPSLSNGNRNDDAAKRESHIEIKNEHDGNNGKPAANDIADAAREAGSKAKALNIDNDKTDESSGTQKINHDNTSDDDEKREPEKPVMKSFVCFRCGACCQTLPDIPEFKGMHDEEHGCIYYDPDTKLCQIYARRPIQCDVLETFNEQFRGKMKWNDYVDNMMRACFLLRQYQGIEEPDKSPYKAEADKLARIKKEREEHCDDDNYELSDDGGKQYDEEFDPVEEMRKIAINVYGEDWFEKQVQHEYDKQIKEIEQNESIDSLDENEKAEGTLDSTEAVDNAHKEHDDTAYNGDTDAEPAMKMQAMRQKTVVLDDSNIPEPTEVDTARKSNDASRENNTQSKNDK